MNSQDFKTPPLEWIRAFEAAARCGSFTAAAAETGLTQSAISQRIGHLEKRLGTALFHRRARSIELTIEGEAWLPYVRTAFDSLRESSEALFGSTRSRLSISASQTIIDQWLMPRLGKLQRATGAQISIQTMILGGHSASEDDVVRIRYGTGDWPHPYKLKLFSERIAPVAAPELAKVRSDPWTEWPRIACAGPRPGWNDWAARFAIPTTPVPTFRFDALTSGLAAARTGMGVCLASLPLCEADLAAGRLMPLGDDILRHHESYWLLAGRDAMARSQWASIEEALR